MIRAGVDSRQRVARDVELAGQVAAPALDRVVGFQAAVVLVAGGDRHVGAGRVGGFAVVVVAPAVDRSVLAKPADVLVVRDDLDEVVVRRHARHDRVAREGRVVAVVAPADDRLRGGQPARMHVSRGDLRVDPCRRRRGHETVVAPALDGVVGMQAAGEVVAGVDLDEVGVGRHRVAVAARSAPVRNRRSPALDRARRTQAAGVIRPGADRREHARRRERLVREIVPPALDQVVVDRVRERLAVAGHDRAGVDRAARDGEVAAVAPVDGSDDVGFVIRPVRIGGVERLDDGVVPDRGGGIVGLGNVERGGDRPRLADRDRAEVARERRDAIAGVRDEAEPVRRKVVDPY